MTTPTTLHEHFEAALGRIPPDRIAYAVDREGISFSELALRVDAITVGLRSQGVEPGSVVGYSLPNCLEVIPLLLAISKLGASAVPLYPMMPDAARAGIFASLGCSLVLANGASVAGLRTAAERMRARYRVVDLQEITCPKGYERPSFEEALDEIKRSAAAPARPLLAAASSGTTGAPKFVWMTQQNAAAVLTATADLARLGSWRAGADYTSMAAFPVSTSSVLVLLGMICAEARMVFSADMSPVNFLELADFWKAEALSAPPSYFEAILNLPPAARRPLPEVKAVFTGMDFLHPGLLARLAERFPSLDRAASGYGLVETSTVFMTWKAIGRDALGGPTSRFELCAEVGNTIDVRDETGKRLPEGESGELWVKGPSVVSGYLGAPNDGATPFVDGWFCTGDVAVRVGESAIELRGRKKYLIKRGGKSVAPTEVQDQLDRCPGVRESAVVGVKHPLYGEMIWAFVVAASDPPVTLKDVMKICRESLPNYMVPDQVSFVAALPRGAGVGKLDREAMIRMAEAELARTAGEDHG